VVERRRHWALALARRLEGGGGVAVGRGGSGALGQGGGVWQGWGCGHV